MHPAQSHLRALHARLLSGGSFPQPVQQQQSQAGGGLAAAAAAAAGADGTQAGGEGGGQGGQGGQGGPPAGQGGDGQQKPAAFRPEGLPDHLFGESDQQTIDKLFKAYAPLKEAQSKFEPGKTPADYVFTPSDKLKPFFGKADDPALLLAQEVFQKTGLPKSSFGAVMEGVFGGLAEKGLLPQPYNPGKELEDLGKALDLKPKEVATAINDAVSFADALAGQLKLPAAVADELKGLTDSASGVQLIRAIQGALKERGIEGAGSGGDAAGGTTKEWLKSMDTDERIDPKSPKFDAALREKYDQGYKDLYRR